MILVYIYLYMKKQNKDYRINTDLHKSMDTLDTLDTLRRSDRYLHRRPG